MKLILTGFMGSGKSSVSKELGKILQLPILEMDEIILQKTKSTDMNEVFAKGGELLLRETEIEIAREYADVKDIVISTGGGVVMNKIILDYLMKGSGKVFFLNASFETIVSRLMNNHDRPLFKSITEAQSLFCLRHPLYLKYADHVIDTDKKTVRKIAEEIVLSLCKEKDG